MAIDYKSVARTKMLADMISEQAEVIMRQAEQIGNLNQLLQDKEREISDLKKTSAEPESVTQ